MKQNLSFWVVARLVPVARRLHRFNLHLMMPGRFAFRLPRAGYAASTAIPHPTPIPPRPVLLPTVESALVRPRSHRPR